MKPIIIAENIEKIYRIGSLHSYKTLRDNLFKFKFEKKQYIKALQDVSFEVYPGEKIGIIGRNGAGKSTLLKIFSRITPPSNGKAILRGKVASLLEIGTGFHGELTGRENIFFNGAILGMKRKEIKQKLDDIVAFAGVEKFLDTPIKHFSSGMQLRLAFAVAAFLDADILLVDEVLAVGDAEFQKKCLGKMDELSKSGRTVLFVSHNLNTLAQLCSKSVYLKNGKIVLFDKTHFVIEQYLQNESGEASFKIWSTPWGDNTVKLHSVFLKNEKNENSYIFQHDEKICIEISFELLKDASPFLNLHFHAITGEKLFVAVQNFQSAAQKKGTYTIRAFIPQNLFNSGKYYIGVAFTTFTPFLIHLYDEQCVFFEISEDVSLRQHPYTQKLPGFFLPKLEWSLITQNI